MMERGCYQLYLIWHQILKEVTKTCQNSSWYFAFVKAEFYHNLKLKLAALLFSPRSLTTLPLCQIWRVRPTLLFPSGGRKKPNNINWLQLPSRPPADRPNGEPVFSTTWLPLPVTGEPKRAVFQPPTHAHTHMPTTHTLSHTRVDSSWGGGAKERLQSANQGSAVQLVVQCLLRCLPASLLCKGWYLSLVGFIFWYFIVHF